MGTSLGSRVLRPGMGSQGLLLPLIAACFLSPRDKVLTPFCSRLQPSTVQIGLTPGGVAGGYLVSALLPGFQDCLRGLRGLHSPPLHCPAPGCSVQFLQAQPTLALPRLPYACPSSVWELLTKEARQELQTAAAPTEDVAFSGKPLSLFPCQSHSVSLNPRAALTRGQDLRNGWTWTQGWEADSERPARVKLGLLWSIMGPVSHGASRTFHDSVPASAVATEEGIRRESKKHGKEGGKLASLVVKKEDQSLE